MPTIETRALIQQSGVIPFCTMWDQLFVGLVRSSDGQRWVTPKGHVEHGLSPQESAMKEAWEEAGMVGNVGEAALGEFVYEKRGRMRHVTLYPMHVTKVEEHYPEEGRRERLWSPFLDAAQLVVNPTLAECIRALPFTAATLQGLLDPADAIDLAFRGPSLKVDVA